MKTCKPANMLSTSAEFRELKNNWIKFISKFQVSAPKIHGAKRNVFYHLVSDTKTEESFVEMARNTRPFLPKKIWELIDQFMDSLRTLPGVEGANYMKVYEGMNPADLVKRLISKRPIVFLEITDDYVLRCLSDPKFKSGKYVSFNNVASNLTEDKVGLPYLKEYISYDEMLLSALIGISTPTYFVSNGALKTPYTSPESPFVEKGVLSAIVGARLEKPGYMESRFALPKQEEEDEYYDQVHHNDLFWIKHVYPEAFPEGKIPTITEITKNPKVYEGIYKNGVNVVFYEKRVMFSIVPFLLDACSRGAESKKNVVSSVPGIGAGVWTGPLRPEFIHEMIVIGLLKYFDNNFDLDKHKYLSGIFLPLVESKIYSNFQPSKFIHSIKVNEKENVCEIIFKDSGDHKLTIFNQRRYVADPLPKGFEDCLVVASYAFDSNSYPGNEYWVDSFSTFDPQAMICSLLSQFQNPEVNTRFMESDRIKVY